MCLTLAQTPILLKAGILSWSCCSQPLPLSSDCPPHSHLLKADGLASSFREKTGRWYQYEKTGCWYQYSQISSFSTSRFTHNSTSSLLSSCLQGKWSPALPTASAPDLPPFITRLPNLHHLPFLCTFPSVYKNVQVSLKGVLLSLSPILFSTPASSKRHYTYHLCILKL